jgi:hypothetical protein
LVLLRAAFGEVNMWKIVLSHLILVLYIFLAWKWALKEYRKRMVE